MMREAENFDKRYFQIKRSEIGYLRFILESYDGVAFVRTLDNREALVEIAYPHSRATDAEELISALVQEAGLKEVPPPESVAPL